MYVFSKKSEEQLKSCHESLQRVVRRVMSWQVMDITVVEGHRSIERQQELFRTGKSKIDGITREGKHNHSPSRAVDIVPYPVDWGDHKRFCILAGMMMAAAKVEDVDLRWGGDWDGDFNIDEHTFIDMPHWEMDNLI